MKLMGWDLSCYLVPQGRKTCALHAVCGPDGQRTKEHPDARIATKKPYKSHIWDSLGNLYTYI